MYMNLMHNDYRLEPLRQTLHGIFGPSFKLVLSVRHEEAAAPGFETLDQLRRAAREARHQKLAGAIAQHPLVQEVELLFAPIKRRVVVALDE